MMKQKKKSILKMLKQSYIGKVYNINKLFPLQSILGPAIKVHLIIINSSDNIAYTSYLIQTLWRYICTRVWIWSSENYHRGGKKLSAYHWCFWGSTETAKNHNHQKWRQGQNVRNKNKKIEKKRETPCTNKFERKEYTYLFTIWKYKFGEEK